MDELIVADVDADVAGSCAGGVGIVKEYQITSSQLRHGCAISKLLRGGAAERIAQLGKDISCKSGAVKAG